ncbi:MAG: VanZ family protein [Bacteroidota bacterium]
MKYNLWAILWGLFVIILLLLPGSVFPAVPGFLSLLNPDKIIHLFLFGTYFFLQFRGFRLQAVFPGLRKNAFVIALSITFTLGAATELVQQYYIPMRSGSVYDLMADMAGALLGWIIAVKFKDTGSATGRV